MATSVSNSVISREGGSLESHFLSLTKDLVCIKCNVKGNLKVHGRGPLRVRCSSKALVSGKVCNRTYEAPQVLNLVKALSVTLPSGLLSDSESSSEWRVAGGKRKRIASSPCRDSVGSLDNVATLSQQNAVLRVQLADSQRQAAEIKAELQSIKTAGEARISALEELVKSLLPVSSLPSPLSSPAVTVDFAARSIGENAAAIGPGLPKDPRPSTYAAAAAAASNRVGTKETDSTCAKPKAQSAKPNARSAKAIAKRAQPNPKKSRRLIVTDRPRPATSAEIDAVIARQSSSPISSSLVFLYVSGLRRLVISDVKCVLLGLGVNLQAIRNIDYIGLDTLEFLTYENYCQELLAKLQAKFDVQHLKEYSPLNGISSSGRDGKSAFVYRMNALLRRTPNIAVLSRLRRFLRNLLATPAEKLLVPVYAGVAATTLAAPSTMEISEPEEPRLLL